MKTEKATTGQTSSQDHVSFFRPRFWQTALLVSAGFWVFSPLLFGGWLWEDDVYITQNVIKHDPGGLWKIWFEPGSFIDYYPIEASVQWAQWHLWHEIPLGYHVTNIVLHIVSAFLLWRLFAQLGLRFAWLGAFIFVIHPMLVESVAWITELKNTLSLPPFLLAMGSLIDYEKRGKTKDYFTALVFFLIAMLCKITMALFPFVILLYLWWKRDRIRWSDFRDMLPFFFISLILGAVTIFAGAHYAQQNGLIDDVPLGGFFSRLANAGLILSTYFLHCLWPVGLLPIYPRWNVDPPSLLQFFPGLIILGLFGWFWKERPSWGRHALLGFGFFTINLAPFMGFNAVSYMRFTWVMDHFIYLPIVGLIGLIIAVVECIDIRLTRTMRRVGIGFLIIILALMAMQARSYAGKFIDQETLWTYTVQHRPDSWVAHNNLGTVLLREGRGAAAAEQYESAVKLNPNSAQVHNNRGVVLEQMGQNAQAAEEYREALRLAPGYHDAQANLERLENISSPVVPH